MQKFLTNMQHAHDVRPDHPRLIYNLAIANSLNGNASQAIALLGELAAMGLSYPAAQDEDLASLHKIPDFKRIATQLENNGKPRGNSKVAFTVNQRGLVAEGLAYDAATADFYIGSIADKRILRVTLEGEASVFAGSEAKLWSVFGLAVDTRHHWLWAATSTHDQMPGLVEKAKGKAAIVAFDLNTGDVKKRWDLPADEPHLVGDLTVAPNGDVFATDSLAKAIYRIPGGRGDLEIFLKRDSFGSLQGIAASPDGHSVYVADYSNGISRIEIASHEVTQYPSPPSTTTLGIDGLYATGDSLIGIQNGVNPQRVIRIRLSPTKQKIEHIEILAAAAPQFDDITLGALVDHAFYFIANSQWRLLGRDGAFTQPEQLTPLKVMRLEL